jgi:hypothetical protein
MNAADTSDLKRAVKGLTALAKAQSDQAEQTRRQADAATSQVAEMRTQTADLAAQAKAAQGQLAAAKSQTKAISEQTSAIKAEADSRIKASAAEKRMADAAAESVIPRVDLGELSISGLTAASPATLLASWRFNNVGSGSFIAKSVDWGIYFGAKLPDEMPLGFHTDGNDYSISNNLVSGLSISDVKLNANLSDISDVLSGTKNVFFFAKIHYVNSSDGAAHTKCFGEQFIMRSPSLNVSAGYKPSGGAAYKCDNLGG